MLNASLVLGELQREKEHKEIDFDSARKRLQQNYRQAENGFNKTRINLVLF